MLVYDFEMKILIMLALGWGFGDRKRPFVLWEIFFGKS